MSSTYGVFLGLEVGKGEHHAVGLDPAGKRLHDAPLPNSEPKLREIFSKLAVHGPVLVIVDSQPVGAEYLVTTAGSSPYVLATANLRFELIQQTGPAL